MPLDFEDDEVEEVDLEATLKQLEEMKVQIEDTIQLSSRHDTAKQKVEEIMEDISSETVVVNEDAESTDLLQMMRETELRHVVRQLRAQRSPEAGSSSGEENVDDDEEPQLSTVQGSVLFGQPVIDHE